MLPSQANSSSQGLKLYRFALSGHCHRIELFLALLNLPVQLIDIDLRAQTQKSAAFLALNPFGQVPLLQDDGIVLADSHAILVYLALKYAPISWFPRDPINQSNIQRWLSVAAGPLAYGPATARKIYLFNAPDNLAEATKQAEKLLSVMEQVLEKSLYLAGDQPTIADIANYSYVAHAPEGGISLNPYPAINAWLKRIEQLPGFISMRSPRPEGEQ